MKLRKEAIKKEIIEVIFKYKLKLGEGYDRPTDLYFVTMSYSAYFDTNSTQLDKKNLFHEEPEPKEYNLNDGSLPEGLVTAITSMRKKETSKLFIRAKYACNYYHLL